MKSRKFIGLWLCVAVVTGALVSAQWFPVITGLYATFVGAVVGLYGIYSGVNAAQKWAVEKKNPKNEPKTS